MNTDPIVIVGLARTPMGAFQGELKGFSAPELGAAAIRAAVERAGRTRTNAPSIPGMVRRTTMVPRWCPPSQREVVTERSSFCQPAPAASSRARAFATGGVSSPSVIRSST